MDHPAIENDEVIERYLRGALGPEETAAFERHFLYCQDCLDQLEMAEHFAKAVKRAAARGLLEETTSPSLPAKSPWYFAGFAAPPSRWLALAALLLFSFGLPLYLLQQRAAVGSEIAVLRQLLEGEKAKAAAAEAEQKRLAQKLEEETSRVAAAPSQVDPHLLPVFLGALRSADNGPDVEITPSADIRQVLLIFELSGRELPSYGMRLQRQGEELWRVDGLRATDLGLVVAVPRSYFLPGVYQLEIVSGETRLARTAFRVP